MCYYCSPSCCCYFVGIIIVVTAVLLFLNVFSSSLISFILLNSVAHMYIIASSSTGYATGSKICTCTIEVDIQKSFGSKDVYLYYELTNYYQVSMSQNSASCNKTILHLLSLACYVSLSLYNTIPLTLIHPYQQTQRIVFLSI